MKRLLLSRRAILAGAAVSAVAATRRRARAAALEMRQFHNQPADTPLHRRLVELWDAVARESEGRLKVRVFAKNGGIAGGDPQALAMLRAGELDFFTLMGGILGEVVP